MTPAWAPGQRTPPRDGELQADPGTPRALAAPSLPLNISSKNPTTNQGEP